MMTGVTVRCLMMLNALSDHAFFFILTMFNVANRQKRSMKSSSTIHKFCLKDGSFNNNTVHPWMKTSNIKYPMHFDK